MIVDAGRNKEIVLVIPCYNGSRYLPGLLSCIERQLFKPSQVLFIDDGSTDDSAAIISHHNAVTLIRHDRNRGLAAARNTAIENTDQGIILFVDVDTLLPDDFVARCRTLYHLYPAMAGIGGEAIETGNQSIYDYWRRLHMSQSFGTEVQKSVRMLWGVCSSYRRNVLDSIGRFNPEFRGNGEDVDMGLRLCNAGHSLLYHPALRVFHRKVDSRDSLVRTLYRWFYWGAVAHRRNGFYPLAGLIKTVAGQIQRTFASPERSAELLKLEWDLLTVRLRAISDSCRPNSPAPPLM